MHGSSLVLYLFIIFVRDLKNKANNIYYIKYLKFCFCENQKIYFKKVIQLCTLDTYEESYSTHVLSFFVNLIRKFSFFKNFTYHLHHNIE